MTDIHFAPDVQGTIAATRAKHYEWTHILGELIDNAFDAGAMRVSITLDGRKLTVEDDGNGCDDIARMLTMGKHSRTQTTKLGRYGVGLKDAAWWVGGPTRIETNHHGKSHRLRLNWDTLSSWSAPSPVAVDAVRSGTIIEFEGISKSRRWPDGERQTAMLKELAFLYSPAIKSGRQIVFKRGKVQQTLERYELPPLSEVVDAEISVEGKTARVHVGIIADGATTTRPGISYTHAFRVINHSALGCGGLGSSRIAGWVSLDKGWALARNKDDITAFKEDLGAAVFAVIGPLVDKASKDALTIKSKSLAEQLTNSFRGIVGESEAEAKERRDSKKRRSGTVNPIGSGKRRLTASKTQPGDGIPAARAGHFRIQFKECDGGSVGSVDVDGRVIWLADNHPTVSSAKAANDELPLLVLAVSLFASQEVHSQAPLLSIMKDETVPRRVEFVIGHLLSEMGAGHQLRSVG